MPPILEHWGYSEANYLGVRLAWLVTGGVALLGAAVFAGYRLGDTPEQTRQNIGTLMDAEVN